MLEHGYDEWRAYRQSKLAQIMFSFECARRFPDVESVALHPATFMDTKMVRSRVGTPASTVQEGADATVRLAAELDLDVQGRYFDGLREARADEHGLRRGRPQAALGRLRAARRLTAAIVITGAPGAGKSSVAQAFTTLLDNAGIEHGAIESEQLAWGTPWLPDAQVHEQLARVLADAARLRAAAVRGGRDDRDPGGPRLAAGRDRRRADVRGLPARAGRGVRGAGAGARARALGGPRARSPRTPASSPR